MRTEREKEDSVFWNLC